MFWLTRFPVLVLVALIAIGVGSVLPFSPAVAAAQSSPPTEEEKNSGDPDDELTHSSNEIPTKPQARSATRERIHPSNSAPPRTRTDRPNATPSLNNGLGAFYRC